MYRVTEVLIVSTTDIGSAAEHSVSTQLAGRGFAILARNWKTKWCEVDIIARHAQTVWFIEVKYRRTAQFGDGLEYIGPSKLRHMRTAAELWVLEHGYDGEYTLGAVAVTADNQVGELVEI